MEDLCIVGDQQCPKCGCCAVLINSDYMYECGFCGTEWCKDNPRDQEDGKKKDNQIS